MTSAKKPETFASQCLEHHKEQMARAIRMHVRKQNLSYTEALPIFGLSRAGMSRVMNGKEREMTFETLYVATVTAGITVSMQLFVHK